MTSTARTAPIGSIVIPSHLAIALTRPFGRTCRRRGTTTVGPVTVRIAPVSSARAGLKPRMTYAAAAASSHARRDQIAHGGADVAQLRQAQAEAALEQDDPDRKRNERVHPVALQHVGPDETGRRTGDEAGQKKQEDRGQAKFPGQPLGTDAQEQNGCDTEKKCHERQATCEESPAGGIGARVVARKPDRFGVGGTKGAGCRSPPNANTREGTENWLRRRGINGAAMERQRGTKGAAVRA